MLAPLSGLVAAAALTFVALGTIATAAAEDYPEFPAAYLKRGRAIWLETCKVCHTTDLAGAPQVTDKDAWAPRLAKGTEVLYAHAIGGFFGPQGTEMPARGANPNLSDDEVRAAVDYMIALVSQ